MRIPSRTSRWRGAVVVVLATAAGAGVGVLFLCDTATNKRRTSIPNVQQQQQQHTSLRQRTTSTRPHQHQHQQRRFLGQDDDVTKWVPAKVQGCAPAVLQTQAQQPVQVQFAFAVVGDPQYFNERGRGLQQQQPTDAGLPCGQPQQPTATTTTNDQYYYYDRTQNQNGNKQGPGNKGQPTDPPPTTTTASNAVGFSTTLEVATANNNNNNGNDATVDDDVYHYHSVVEPLHANNTVQVAISVALPLTWNPFYQPRDDAEEELENNATWNNNNNNKTNPTYNHTYTSSPKKMMRIAHHDQLAALLMHHIATTITNVFAITLDHAIDMHTIQPQSDTTTSSSSTTTTTNDVLFGGANQDDLVIPQGDWLEQRVLQYLYNVTILTPSTSTPAPTGSRSNQDDMNDAEDDNGTTLEDAVSNLIHDDTATNYINLQAILQQLPTYDYYKSNDRWDMFLQDVSMELVTVADQYAWWKFTMVYPVLFAKNDNTSNGQPLQQQQPLQKQAVDQYYLYDSFESTTNAPLYNNPNTNLIPVDDPNVLRFISRLLIQTLQRATASGALLDNFRQHAASPAFVEAAQVAANVRYQNDLLDLQQDQQEQDLDLAMMSLNATTNNNKNNSTNSSSFYRGDNNNNDTTDTSALDEHIKGHSIVLAVSPPGQEFVLFFFLIPGKPMSDGVWVPAFEANDYMGGDMQLYQPKPTKPLQTLDSPDDTRPWGTYPFALGSKFDIVVNRQQDQARQTRTKIGNWMLVVTVSLVVCLLLAAWLRASLRQRRRVDATWGSLATESDVNELLRMGWRCHIVEPPRDGTERTADANGSSLATAHQVQPKLIMEIYERTNSSIGYQDDDSMLHGSSMPVPAPPSSLLTASSVR